MTLVNPRFWAKVDKGGPMPDPETGVTTCCYQWLGSLVNQGYGCFWWQDRQFGSHQAAWLLAGNELPVHPLTLDHLCRNRACVRLDHLCVATKLMQEVNKGLNKNNTSGERGVTLCKQTGKWRVLIRYEGRLYSGGRYADLGDAKRVARTMRNQIFGPLVKQTPK